MADQFIHTHGSYYQTNLQHRGCDCACHLVAQGFWPFHLPYEYQRIKSVSIHTKNKKYES